MNSRPILAAAAAALLAGCSAGADQASSAAGTAEAAEQPVRIEAPAGVYKLDPNHASLIWSVKHMGLSDYTARFTKFDSTITLDPNNIAASDVQLTIDPTSVRTDYPGDYRGTHKNSSFASWDEDLAQSERFFNAGKFGQITFDSTRVEPTGARTAKVTGDLTFLGVTKPVTMDVTFNGELASHPATKTPAIGFTAVGEFNRSDFGMRVGGSTGDAVRVVFNGEYLLQPASPPVER